MLKVASKQKDAERFPRPSVLGAEEAYSAQGMLMELPVNRVFQHLCPNVSPELLQRD